MHLFTVFTVSVLAPLILALPSQEVQECDSDTFTVGQVVNTTSGPVSGHASAKNEEVSEYLGIPFGKPPVDELRFAAPVAYTGSSAINGSAYGHSCMQLSGTASVSTPSAAVIAASNVTAVGLTLFGLMGGASGITYSEDCLYLNVWTKPQSGEKKKAVMVYLYGGGFIGGSSASPTYDGSTLAELEDVIIVSLNYRLSVLGWPGNPNAQQNIGFLDQRLGLEWVRDNIASFGGDPSRITLFGQSAGGASTDNLIYAFASDPIAAGVIEQSGTALSFGLPYTQNTSAANWYSVTSTVGCGDASTDPSTLLTCMQAVNVSSILAAVPRTGVFAILSAFGPTIDEVLVFSNYSDRKPAAIPIMLGDDDNEAGLFRTQLALANETFPDEIWTDLNLASWECPASLRANYSVAAGNPTWRFRYHGIFPNTNISSEAGAWHGAELQLIFGTTGLTSPPNNTVEENAFERYIQGAWTTFAKDPVNGLRTYEGGWPLYDPVKKTLIRLAYENEVGTNLEYPEVYDANCGGMTVSALLCAVYGECDFNQG